MNNSQFKPIPSNIAIDLYTGQVNARQTKLQPALNAVVKVIGVVAIDEDLKRLVSINLLNHLASLGLRGERVFPVPVIIQHTPALIGYYRMLLGISQKEFRQPQRLGYGAWVNAENSNKLAPALLPLLDQFCRALIVPLEQLVNAMNQFSDRDLNDMSLLTLGSTLQGGRNNVIGSKAAQDIFSALRAAVQEMMILDTPKMVRFQSNTGRVFEIIPASDPDVAIDEITGNQRTQLLAIEIKGGKDASNAYNRAGEAEKSHIVAKIKGYQQRWTIIHMAGVNRQDICQKTPSSTEVFETADILQQSGDDWINFQYKLSQLTAS